MLPRIRWRPRVTCGESPACKYGIRPTISHLHTVNSQPTFSPSSTPIAVPFEGNPWPCKWLGVSFWVDLAPLDPFFSARTQKAPDATVDKTRTPGPTDPNRTARPGSVRVQIWARWRHCLPSLGGQTVRTEVPQGGKRAGGLGSQPSRNRCAAFTQPRQKWITFVIVRAGSAVCVGTPERPPQANRQRRPSPWRFPLQRLRAPSLRQG